MRMPKYLAYRESGIPWAESVPAHWPVMPLLGVAAERSESNAGMVEDNLLSLSYGRIVSKDIESNDGLLPESFETYQVVYAGDIVLRLTDLQNDKRSLRSAAVHERGIITSAYLALRPEGANSEFLSYLLRAYDLRKVFYSMGGGLRQSMKFADLKRMPVPVPPASEQTAIATFLDHETAKIDGLIAEQEKLIALLAEKRQAIISHAVTRGLNPQAPMKDSGVPWLGEVPAHWAVKRMKQLVVEGIAGPYGSSLTKDMYTSQGYRVYGQQQVIPGDFSIGDYYISEEKFAEMSRYVVAEGDLLVSVMGTIGRAAVVPSNAEPGIINPRLVLYRVNRKVVRPDYVQLCLSAPSSQRYFALAAQGTTMEGLNMSSIGSLWVAVPPLREQTDILESVQAEAGRLSAATRDVERAVLLLKERRSALIAAAVTGQVDVRGLSLQP